MNEVFQKMDQACDVLFFSARNNLNARASYVAEPRQVDKLTIQQFLGVTMGLDAVEEEANGYVQRLRECEKPASANPHGSVFVFLDLLKCETNFTT